MERRWNGLHLPPSVKHRPHRDLRHVPTQRAPVLFIFGGGESIAMTCCREKEGEKGQANLTPSPEKRWREDGMGFICRPLSSTAHTETYAMYRLNALPFFSSSGAASQSP